MCLWFLQQEKYFMVMQYNVYTIVTIRMYICH